MPNTSSVMTPSPTPRLVLSQAAEDDVDGSYTDRSSLSSTSTANIREQGKAQTHSDWIDVDDRSGPRRRKRSRRTSTRTDGPTPSTKHPQKSSITDLGRFLPKLTQILEANELRPQQHTVDRVVARDKTKDDVSVGYRRPIRSRNISVQRRQDNRAKLNASLLSVISGLTTSSDRSSGSNSTVTQQSYSRATSSSGSLYNSRFRGDTPSRNSIMSTSPASRAASIYSLEPYDLNEDARSDISGSTSSSLRSTGAGSSVLSGTPSSRSTYPSPKLARDLPDGSSNKVDYYSSAPVQSKSPNGQNQHRRSHLEELSAQTSPFSVHEYPETENETCSGADATPMPTHPYAYNDHFTSELEGEAASSSARELDKALTKLYWPGAAIEPTTSDEDNHDAVVPPPAPEAPDNSKKTLIGYEMLATELCSSSNVRPMYRKFEFLNHRLLLHLQDELAELEEQLRTVDEMIAQMSQDASGLPVPSSRRGEAYYGVDLHHYRTNLLGRIFLKTKQYNKSMSSFSNMLRDCLPANADEIQAYRTWLVQHAPIHKAETQFLLDDQDLVTFNKSATMQPAPTRPNSFIVYGPLCFGLPILLVGIMPTIFSRMAVLTMLLVASIPIAFLTRLNKAFQRREIFIGLSSYAFCFTAIALLLPTRPSTPIID